MPDRDKILKIGDAIVVLPGKSPDEMFLMALCLVSSIPILFGGVPAPGSIDETMEPWLVFAWSLTLAVGALVVLISFTVKDRITGMIIEQVGSICLGVAATVYGLIILATSFDNGGAIPAVIVMGFAIARFLQFRSHQKTLNKIAKVKTKLAVLNEEEARGD
jgi:formate hydrogenlyase subunit 3/multisubunit Na+/H+ antiporter MnhD subunit